MLMVTPATSAACVVISPTTRSTTPISTTAPAVSVRRSQARSMVCGS